LASQPPIEVPRRAHMREVGSGTVRCDAKIVFVRTLLKAL